MQTLAKILLQAAIINIIDWVTESASFTQSSGGQDSQGQVISQFGVSENSLPGLQMVPSCCVFMAKRERALGLLIRMLIPSWGLQHHYLI